MSRALISIVFSVLGLGGCVNSQPAKIEVTTPAEIVVHSSLQPWLTQLQVVAEMPPQEIVSELIELDQPEGAEELFLYAALNQQLQTFASWAQARDSFRLLQADEQLASEQRQLAGILQQYNQNRINWYQRQSDLLLQNEELQQQLTQAEQEKLLLEQKIQALTDLEEDISTRKEQ